MTPLGLFLLCTVTAATAQPTTPITTDKERQSYVLGQDAAESIKRLNADVDINAFLQGIRDNLEGKASQLSEADLTKARDTAHASLLQNRQKKLAEDGAKYGKAGQDFMAKHKTEKGVITTPSGLQYEVLTATPPGAHPAATHRVVFDYTASVVGGAPFDSSAAHGKPAILGVSAGIKGWTEAFQLMTLGSKYRFVIPPQLAYGAEGIPGKVPPNATLIYEITLRDVLH